MLLTDGHKSSIIKEYLQDLFVGPITYLFGQTVTCHRVIPWYVCCQHCYYYPKYIQDDI